MVDLRMDRLGTKTPVGDRVRLDYEREVQAPIDRVWRALVEPAEAATWWGVDSVTVEPGQRYLLHGGEMPPGGPITAWDPPHLLAFEWNRDETDTPQVITFRLTAQGDRTHLHFSHEGLLESWSESVLPGWHAVLVQLEATIAGEPYDGTAIFEAVGPLYGAMRSPDEYRAGGGRAIDLDEGRLGTVERTHDGAHTTLRFTRQLDASPGAVWGALTDPGELSVWMNCPVDVVPGERIIFYFGDGDLVQDCAITEWEPGERLAFEWNDYYPRRDPSDEGYQASLVTFELEAHEGGTRLVLLHTLGQPVSAPENLGGWHGHLVALREHLDGRRVEFEPLFAVTERFYQGVSIS